MTEVMAFSTSDDRIIVVRVLMVVGKILIKVGLLVLMLADWLFVVCCRGYDLPIHVVPKTPSYASLSSSSSSFFSLSCSTTYSYLFPIPLFPPSFANHHPPPFLLPTFPLLLSLYYSSPSISSFSSSFSQSMFFVYESYLLIKT